MVEIWYLAFKSPISILYIDGLSAAAKNQLQIANFMQTLEAVDENIILSFFTFHKPNMILKLANDYSPSL